MMKQSIDRLKQLMYTTASMNHSISFDKEDKENLVKEITAYCKAINELELFYEGEKVTDIKQVLYNYDLD